MTDTQWADISKYNPLASDVYPYRWIAIRSNDGTLDDEHFQQNLAWAKHACDLGKLDGFIVYVVYETNVSQTVANLIQNVGAPHLKMAVEIDVESWGGRISGNQTVGIEQMRRSIVAWLGNNAKRCIVYGNVNDLKTLYPGKPSGVRVVVADYSSNPSYPDKLAHQYADNFNVAPFGPCDINSADGYTSAQVAAALGVPFGPLTPAPEPTPQPPVYPASGDDLLDLAYFLVYGQQHGRWNAQTHAFLTKDTGAGLAAAVKKLGL